MSEAVENVCEENMPKPINEAHIIDDIERCTVEAEDEGEEFLALRFRLDEWRWILKACYKWKADEPYGDTKPNYDGILENMKECQFDNECLRDKLRNRERLVNNLMKILSSVNIEVEDIN